MRFTRSVQFEPTEVEVFERALPAGYDSALGLGDNDKPRVRSLRTRLTQTIRPGEPERRITTGIPCMRLRGENRKELT